MTVTNKKVCSDLQQGEATSFFSQSESKVEISAQDGLANIKTLIMRMGSADSVFLKEMLIKSDVEIVSDFRSD